MTTLTRCEYSYSSILKDAAKINWRIQDVMGDGTALDFTMRFLPEALSHTDAIACLTPMERLTLNHIRGHSYLHLFGLLEEAILPLVVNHVQSIGTDAIEATQAYLGFAEEESKHIHLFRRFAAAFEAGFGHPCDCIGPSAAIAQDILQHRPLGVALLTLHIEWMTQRHFLDSVRGHEGALLDPQFCSLLRYHWQEEAQHARLDALMVQAMAEDLDAPAIAIAIDDYLALIQYLNTGLMNQVKLDITTLERAIGFPFSHGERDAIRRVQSSSYQQVFLVAGMTHPNFVDSVRTISPHGYEAIADVANQLVQGCYPCKL